MRKLFFAVLFTLMLALPLSVLAKEYELVNFDGITIPVGPQNLLPTESEVVRDDGSGSYVWGGSSWYDDVNTLTMPANGWITKVKVFFGKATGAPTSGWIKWDLLQNNGTYPTTPPTSLIGGPFTYSFSGGLTASWYTWTLATPVYFASGTKVHPGMSGHNTAGSNDYRVGILSDGLTSSPNDSFYDYYGGWYGGYASYYGAIMGRIFYNNDVTPPYADTFAPANGSWQLANLDSISFHAKDDDTSSGGVNTTTVGFSADDGTKATVPGTLGFDTTNPYDVICTFNVDDGYDFPDGTTTCTIPAGMRDMLGNTQASSYNWSFYVDGTAPAVSGQNPADGGYGQPNTTIVFHVTDGGCGVDIGSITFTAEDSPKSISQKDTVSPSNESTSLVVSNSKAVIPGTLYIDDTNPNDVICTFTPDSDLTVGDTITCTVAQGLSDVLGNSTESSIVWHFTVEPYTIITPASLGHIKAQFN